MNAAAWCARLVAVVALLTLAALLATPPGRLPLALRGLAKLLRSDRGEKTAVPPPATVGRRLVAFVAVLAAVLVALWPT